MTRSARTVRLAVLFILLFSTATGGTSPPRAAPVAAWIETTVTTRHAQIRPLAFDADGASFFTSK